MKPSDEQLSRAMHRLEPSVTDTPDLFEKVAAGARKRRRRVYSTSAVAGAAVAVAAAALVPTLTSGVSHSRGVQTAAGNGDIDPGFTGLGAPGSTMPSPTGVRGTASAVASPARTASTSPDVDASPAPTPLPTDAKGCPKVTSLPPGPDAEANARAAAIAAIPARYGADMMAKGYTVKSVYPASTGQGFGIVADAICGKTLGDNSYVVELGFASDSASMGSGQLFVANFPGGWQVWFQYH